MKVKEVNLLKESLEEFYGRLIDGKIEQAKNTLEFAFKIFNELRVIIPAIIQSLEEDGANQIKDAWQTVQTALIEFKLLADKELNITDQTFAEDPETWKELLSCVFKEKKDVIGSLLERMSDFLKTPVQSQILPPFEYSPEYAKLKEKDNLYSQYKERITAVEEKILFYVSKGWFDVPGVTQKIKTGLWRGWRHADLPHPMGDHRIVYSWNDEKALFKTIDTHKHLGIA
ncbi:MAG: hypothetical protein NTW67_04480 [Candidatus Woesearchaeota archaeon]|nr:hypothetical protein [Candidatus Woesearchaeota archaeon]